jgi:hypothetical protein
MPEEVREGEGSRGQPSGANTAHEERLRVIEARLWKGGLIAALVFVGFTTLYNGYAYRKLTRAQQRLAVALSQQALRPRPAPYGPFWGPGMGRWRFPPPPGPGAFYGPPPYGQPPSGWRGWRGPSWQGGGQQEQSQGEPPPSGPPGQSSRSAP